MSLQIMFSPDTSLEYDICNTVYGCQTISNREIKTRCLSIKKHAIKHICVYLHQNSCLHARRWTIKPFVNVMHYIRQISLLQAHWLHVTPISISSSLSPPTLCHLPWKLIMQAIISHNVFHPRVQVYGNSDLISYFSRWSLCRCFHPRDLLRVVLSKKNVKYHITSCVNSYCNVFLESSLTFKIPLQDSFDKSNKIQPE